MSILQRVKLACRVLRGKRPISIQITLHPMTHVEYFTIYQSDYYPVNITFTAQEARRG